MKKQKNNLGTIFLTIFMFVSYCGLLIIVGPRDKKHSKYNSTDWFGGKEKRSLHREILRGEIGSLDTLLMVINKRDTLLKEIPYSKRVKFYIDTTIKSTNRVVLISSVSKKPIKFLLLHSKWLGFYRKEFRGMEMF